MSAATRSHPNASAPQAFVLLARSFIGQQWAQAGMTMRVEMGSVQALSPPHRYLSSERLAL